MESYIPTREKLLSEIERIGPDVVAFNLDLYAGIDGIETSRMIRSRFFVPVMYVSIMAPGLRYHNHKTDFKFPNNIADTPIA